MGTAGTRLAVALTVAAGLAGCSLFDTGPAEPTATAPSERTSRDAAPDGVRPYADVIPDDAVSDSGMVVVHRVDDDWFFEIPEALLGRDLLFITRIAGVPPGLGGFLPAGVSLEEQVMRFERRGDRLMLRKQTFQQVAADSLPISLSVVQNNLPPVIAGFDLEAAGTDSLAPSLVIDVTDFFAGDTPAISGMRAAMRRQYQVRRLDPSRSFVERISSYPENVEVRHTQTFDAAAPPSDADTNTITLEVSQSIVLLPEEPMRPRYADPRVGYFSINRINYGLDVQKAGQETFIRRWRLEPSDSAAYFRGEVVEPVEPITYYIDPATPERWRPWVKQGVEDWNEAFESAGFRNAIRALDPPSPEEDPEWDPEDTRYSVVRWAASLTRNAQGPSTSDPRTGEIIESDIVWYHNHMRSYRNWLMVQSGAAMEEARSLDIPERVMGEAMRQVIAHEIGHALGLPHNMISSSAFPTDSLRNADFSRRMGVAPSVMDYARQNYIAQPGDGLDAIAFIRKIGPYDHYSIEWGYRLINTPRAEDERPILNGWIVRRADDPMYRYAAQGAFSGIDPRAQTEDMGDDPVASSTYGLENLQRIVPNLPGWTATEGQDYTDLAELYGEALGQYSRYLGHVLTLVGGAYIDLKSTEQEGPVFDGVPRERQREAMTFLRRHAFTAPEWLNDRDILDRIGPLGRFEGLQARQISVLDRLLDPRRLTRLAEMEVLQPEDAYRLTEFMDDLRVALWAELDGGRSVAPYRRALQRAHLERLEYLMTAELTSSPFFGPAPALDRSDIRPLVREQLVGLDGEAEAALLRVRHRVTRAHLEDVRARIAGILDSPVTEEGG
ncbi:MAG: zinc-dependent metalloprotease [Gemmatimonadetes bacterium]|nr:zinc-dependent metalloprotease [Gemmatimonadota bacterium]